MAEVLAHVFRNGRIESIHRGDFAVATPAGDNVASVGNIELSTYMRSTAKPFQAMPLLESGAVKHFEFSVQELAVMMASHNGEAVHIIAVNSILAKAGLTTGDLRCGFHRPLAENAADAWLSSGQERSPVYNNCSGKHAGMLALAKFLETPLDTYLQPDHPVQQRILHKISVLAGLAENEIGIGIDGCSAPVFYMPLRNMATAYARLTDGKLPAAELAFKIMSANPEMVGGTGRFDTALMRITGGRMVSKVGAEGVRCCGVRGKQPLGIALKISDGGRRASEVVLLEILSQLSLLSENELHLLAAFHHPRIVNCAGIDVGEVRADFMV